jgi:hypothetical protein
MAVALGNPPARTRDRGILWSARTSIDPIRYIRPMYRREPALMLGAQQVQLGSLASPFRTGPSSNRGRELQRYASPAQQTNRPLRHPNAAVIQARCNLPERRSGFPRWQAPAPASVALPAHRSARAVRHRSDRDGRRGASLLPRPPHSVQSPVLRPSSLRLSVATISRFSRRKPVGHYQPGGASPLLMSWSTLKPFASLSHTMCET